MMKKIIALMLTLALVFTLASCGGTATKPEEDVAPLSQLEQIKANGKLVLGTEAFFAPYEFHITENGVDKIVGFDIDLAQAIADEIGVELEIKDMAFDSLLIELGNGSVDLVIAGLSPKPDRAEVSDFSDIYYGGGQSLVIIEANKDKYSSYADFKGLQIAAQMGSIQADLLTDNTPDATPVLLSTNDDIVMQLLSGKVEAAYIETLVLEQYQKSYPELMELCPVEYGEEGSIVAVKKGADADYLELINKVIAELKNSGQMDKNVAAAQELEAKYAA